MKAPTPLFLLLLFISMLYVGLIAFFPSLRSANSRKKRKPITRPKGILFICISTLGIIYSSYVIYVFMGGSYRVLPLSDKDLFMSADMMPFILIGGLLLVLTIFGKKDKNQDKTE